MESELLAKLIQGGGASAVAVIVVVFMFLKALKHYVDKIDKLGDRCHDRTAADQKAFQEQIEKITAQTERLANRYHEAMETFAAAIARNGDTLQRMEDVLHRRGVGPANR